MKRNEQMVPLSKDHHFTLLFCWKIRNGLKLGVDPGRIIKYVQYFWKYHIQPHFSAEETILFAFVKDAQIKRALHEHTLISEQIKALNNDSGPLQKKLALLADTVDDHVRYEERELFPRLENVLTDEQLKNIGKQLEAQHDPDAKDDFGDEFWLKGGNA